MTEHPRIAQKRLAEAGEFGQWLEEAGTEWEAHGVVAAEVWQRIEEKALEVAALARELASSEKSEAGLRPSTNSPHQKRRRTQ